MEPQGRVATSPWGVRVSVRAFTYTQTQESERGGRRGVSAGAVSIRVSTGLGSVRRLIPGLGVSQRLAFSPRNPALAGRGS